MMKIVLKRESTEENTFAVITCNDWAGEPWEFMHTLKQALTYWFKNDQDGIRAWKFESKKEFTIKNLSSYVPDCFLRTTRLARIFRQHGISYFNVELVSDEGGVVEDTYDTVLVVEGDMQ